MQRLELKWQTIRGLVPQAEVASQGQRVGVLFYGTTALPMPEAVDLLQADGIALDSCRVRAFPSVRKLSPLCKSMTSCSWWSKTEMHKCARC